MKYKCNHVGGQLTKYCFVAIGLLPTYLVPTHCLYYSPLPRIGTIARPSYEAYSPVKLNVDIRWKPWCEQTLSDPSM